MTDTVLEQRLGRVESELIALNPLRVCAALPELEVLLPFAAAVPDSIGQIRRIQLLAKQAASIYSGWITVAASLSGGYDATGHPAISIGGVLRTEG